MKLFKLRGALSSKESLLLALLGAAFVLLLWFVVTMGAAPIVPSAILPAPLKVLGAYRDLYLDNQIVRNTCLSVGLNLAGYVEAMVISLPIGFAIGLFPLFRGGFQRQVNAIRYVPLTAVTGIFIAWFGIGIPMKVHFLAFGILIYILPMVVQRIDEVNDVYLKTTHTLGASAWQTIRTVYIPSVFSKLSDDIRVLTAISWTYIIVIENINSEGGIGQLIWRVGQRQFRMDKVFAMLIIIMIIGLLTDKLFTRLDREFFPHKYQIKDQYKIGLIEKQSVWDVIMAYISRTVIWVGLGIYLILFINEFIPFLGDVRPFEYLFGGTAWVVHVAMLSLVVYQVKCLLDRRKKSPRNKLAKETLPVETDEEQSNSDV